MHAFVGKGEEADRETLQGDCFKRNSAHLDVSSGLFVVFLVRHNKTLRYLRGAGQGLVVGSICTMNFQHFR